MRGLLEDIIASTIVLSFSILFFLYFFQHSLSFLQLSVAAKQGTYSFYIFFTIYKSKLIHGGTPGLDFIFLMKNLSIQSEAAELKCVNTHGLIPLEV